MNTNYLRKIADVKKAGGSVLQEPIDPENAGAKVHELSENWGSVGTLTELENWWQSRQGYSMSLENSKVGSGKQNQKS